MIHNATILITGGAGFIGSSLTKRLVEHNKVRIFDNLRRNALKDSGLDNHPNLELVVGDYAAVRKATEGVQYVIHMAAIAGVDTVLRNPVLTMEIALAGTMNALKAAVEAGGVKRFASHAIAEFRFSLP